VNYDQNDIHSLALCAWKEARGESQPQGCDAVMYVIVNRVGQPGFARDLHGVIYGKNQFTSMSVPSDPEFNLQPKDGDTTFQACLDAASSILANVDNPDRIDITRGAHYYANLHTCTSGWFHDHIVLDSHNHPVTAQIGRHTFFL
jgi:spore germination cell wall hydrolase CwlJ-like protein